jgi:AraC-like DNA-binding protein
MLIDARGTHVEALDGGYSLVDVRTPELRVFSLRSRRLITDWGLVDRASPFTRRPAGVEIVVTLQGEARFEEGGRRAFLSPGDLVRDEIARGGTQACAGEASWILCIEWEPRVHGGAFAGPFAIERLSRRDLARVAEGARRLAGPDPARAVADIFAALRAAGAGFDPIAPGQLADAPCADLVPLHTAISRQLAAIEASPAIKDLSARLGWNERRIHRGAGELARAYRLTWQNWREAIYRARMLQALRLVGAPGATTELVARLAGYRSPSALCHAFAKAGLPSPGELARAAKREALARWGELLDGARPRPSEPTTLRPPQHERHDRRGPNASER